MTQDESETVVYQTRIVHNDFSRAAARNLFADPQEAKRYLETYVEERYDATPGEWQSEESADEKWSMYPDGIDGRAVVMGWTVFESADEPIDRFRKVLKEVKTIV